MLMSWWCHVTLVTGQWLVTSIITLVTSDVLPTRSSSDVITLLHVTCHIPPGPGLWSSAHDPVSAVKWKLWKLFLMMWTRLWSVIMLMIGIHMSLGNSWVPTLRPLPVCLTSWLLSPAHHLIIMTIITRLITQTPYTLHIRHYTTLASFFIHSSVFSPVSINIWTACRWWRLT